VALEPDVIGMILPLARRLPAAAEAAAASDRGVAAGESTVHRIMLKKSRFFMTDPLELRATDLLTTLFDADLAARGLWLWAGGDGNALVFASDARETLCGIWRMARAGGDGRPACAALLREALFESPGDLAALRLSRDLVEEASTDWMDQVAVTALHLGRAPGGVWEDDSQLAIALATLPEMPPTTLVLALAATLDRHLSSEAHAGLLARADAWTIAPAEDFDRERLFAPASVLRALATLLHGVEALAGPANAREFTRISTAWRALFDTSHGLGPDALAELLEGPMASERLRLHYLALHMQSLPLSHYAASMERVVRQVARRGDPRAWPEIAPRARALADALRATLPQSVTSHGREV
jgi:hypothetical protein